jgi:tetratricopeptide (TPR) repeat protein
MTQPLSPQTIAQPMLEESPTPAAKEVRRRGPSRLLLGVLGVLLLIAVTYAFAWFQASRLSARFVSDADASYAQGEFLEALVGYEKFDEARNIYVTHGGYVQVERIWSNRYSWPLVPELAHARERIQEIINQRLTVDQAETFIRNNTGKPAAYFGEIYVRLGELYAAQGLTRDARDVFEAIPQLFPSREDLIQRAQAGLTALGPG